MKAKKGNKRGKSDAIYAKKSRVIEKKQNPFELHVNREKFNILNRKRNHSLGQPLVSRQKAFEKRKETLGAEYSVRNKANVFEDRRKSGHKRLAKESIYNLNDSEVLTHRGQTLEEIEQFDDVLPDEDDEISDEEARLDANFTKSAHFGGGAFEEDFDGGSGKDRKTVIEELIADSKKRKAERMKEHEEMLDLTNKLDTNWKDLIAVMKKMERTETPDKPEPDSYDRLVKEMIFSPRGEPTEKLKSEEELARLEREKLENLEALRLSRMHDTDDGAAKKSNYRSADDLDDGYLFETVNEEDESQVLSYPPDSENTDAENCAEEVDSDENDDGEQQGEENDDLEEEEEEDEEASEVDSLEDLKSDDESEGEEQAEDEKRVVEKGPSEEPKVDHSLDAVPFTIPMPASYESLLELLQNHSIKIQGLIVERIIKTNHPKLYFLNKGKMQKLFTYLLQYINDLFANYDESNVAKKFKVIRHLAPHLFDLVQMSPDECSQSFLEVVKEKYEDYAKNPRLFPKLNTLIFFHIMGALFPTSDFRHPVVTPCTIFLHHILSQARIKSRFSVSAGLFLVTLILDHQRTSRRFLPSVMNFLTGVCYLGFRKSPVENSKTVPPFKNRNELLVLGKSYQQNEFSAKDHLKPTDFVDSPIDDNFKVRTLNLASCLMRDFVELYDEHEGVKYFLDPFGNALARLSDDDRLPQALRSKMDGISKDFQKIGNEKSFKYPASEKKNIPMLRMLEPRFENVHTDRRQMYCQAGNSEKRKLKHMVKRETKAAKRELRRDNEFLSKIKHRRQQRMDTERKEKVKRIFEEANLQQSEFKALSRTKGRKGAF